MKWVSAVSERPSLESALAEAVVAVRARLEGHSPDLAVVFVSDDHAEQWDDLPEALAEALPARVIIGCTAGGVVGGGRELEQVCSLSLTAASMPGVTIKPFHLDTTDVPDPRAALDFYTDLLDLGEESPRFVVLPDPMTCPVQQLLAGLDAAFPDASTIGGLASGGHRVGRHALFLNHETYRGGVVGLALTGNVQVDALVAQGCRPIGQPMFVTQCHENIIHEIDGQPVVELLKSLYASLTARDQKLFRHSLFLGVVMRELQTEYHDGDYLIRNLLGIDSTTNGLRVAAKLRPNQVIQFHLRDADTSSENLRMILKRYHASLPPSGHPPGGLMFSCLGRGARLYGNPDHDSNVVKEIFTQTRLGGFFCNGEIGPVQGSTFLHGYTSVLGMFRPRSD